MKKCSKCKVEKSLREFNRSGRSKDGYHCYCRDCHKQNYEINKKTHIAKVVDRKNQQKEIGTQWKWDYLVKSGGCSYDGCDVINPIMLEFDHIDKEDKTSSISRMIQGGYSVNALEKEAQKCRILCANHHRLRTAQQFNWKVYMPQ